MTTPAVHSSAIDPVLQALDNPPENSAQSSTPPGLPVIIPPEPYVPVPYQPSMGGPPLLNFIPVYRACESCRNRRKNCPHKQLYELPKKSDGPNARPRPVQLPEGFEPPPVPKKRKRRPKSELDAEKLVKEERRNKHSRPSSSAYDTAFETPLQPPQTVGAFQVTPGWDASGTPAVLNGVQQLKATIETAVKQQQANEAARAARPRPVEAVKEAELPGEDGLFDTIVLANSYITRPTQNTRFKSNLKGSMTTASKPAPQAAKAAPTSKAKKAAPSRAKLAQSTRRNRKGADADAGTDVEAAIDAGRPQASTNLSVPLLDASAGPVLNTSASSAIPPPSQPERGLLATASATLVAAEVLSNMPEEEELVVAGSDKELGGSMFDGVDDREPEYYEPMQPAESLSPSPDFDISHIPPRSSNQIFRSTISPTPSPASSRSSTPARSPTRSRSNSPLPYPNYILRQNVVDTRKQKPIPAKLASTIAKWKDPTKDLAGRWSGPKVVTPLTAPPGTKDDGRGRFMSGGVRRLPDDLQKIVDTLKRDKRERGDKVLRAAVFGLQGSPEL